MSSKYVGNSEHYVGTLWIRCLLNYFSFFRTHVRSRWLISDHDIRSRLISVLTIEIISATCLFHVNWLERCQVWMVEWVLGLFFWFLCLHRNKELLKTFCKEAPELLSPIRRSLINYRTELQQMSALQEQILKVCWVHTKHQLSDLRLYITSEVHAGEVMQNDAKWRTFPASYKDCGACLFK